jgi:hypothetical protein
MNVSSAQINEQNRQFWIKQSALRDERMSDPTIFKIATRSMNWEAVSGVPVKFRKTFELALDHAASERGLFRSEHSRKAGRAPKGDALSDLIQRLVFLNPKITEKELLRQLEAQVGQDTILSIEAESQSLANDARRIYFEEEDGRPREASVPGLKDRLSRAKAKINSR